ncbi:MAG: carbamoyl phosphate synthase large subunit, partial [Methyloceanibacter sp.]
MSKRTDIKSILIIGAGPIIIGQACEFDYSGTQACKALKEEGYRIVLVNSNPATIMTDPDLADATYIEPITPEIVAKIIEKERPDAVLPTMGGQTALNTALSLNKMGVLEKFGVEMIGAHAEAIDKAEDRELFREAMNKIGLETPASRLADAASLKRADRETYKTEIARIEAEATDPEVRAKVLLEFEADWARHESERRRRYVEKGLIEALEALQDIGLPAIIRPSFTLGGTGGGIAYNREEFMEIVERGLDASPTCEVLIEESVLGWKELELEVVRDSKNQMITVCFIENVDAMGVHTGDSYCTAPMLTIAPE